MLYILVSFTWGIPGIVPDVVTILTQRLIRGLHFEILIFFSFKKALFIF